MSEGFHRQYVVILGGAYVAVFTTASSSLQRESKLSSWTISVACPALKYLQAKKNNF